MDIIWHQLQEMKSQIVCNYRFTHLFKVATIILVMPHSNAGIKYIYSIINKNKFKNSDCNQLDVNRSLSSILLIKLDQPESDHKCYNFHPNKKLIKDTKQATGKYNKFHLSSKSLRLINVSKHLETFVLKMYCCCQKMMSCFSIQFGTLHIKINICNTLIVR